MADWRRKEDLVLKVTALVVALLAGIALSHPANATRSDVDTNAALKALTGGVTTTAYRAGYYSAGDGGDALYSWNGASSCTDDGGSCIQPNSGTGRWILNANGAQSIKVFGAKCDGSTNDTTAIKNDLTAYNSAMVPAKSTCRVAMASASDGLVLGSTSCYPCGSAHLFGQDKQTSVLLFDRSITPSYDFVTAHQFVNIVVSSNVATVTTVWSHQLKPSQTVTISGSATTGLNGTFTIRGIGSLPAQTDSYNTFSFTTTGVANGTYTDPTHITGQSGINIAAISSAVRDVNDPNKSVTFELDHLTLRAGGTQVPMTWIDLSGTRNTSVHDIVVDMQNDTGTYYDNMEVMVRYADRSPVDFNKKTDSYFDHVYDISTIGGITFALQAPSQDGSANQGLFERWNTCSEVLGDFNGNQQNNGLTLTQWYACSDASPLSADFTNGGPGRSFLSVLGIEGAKTIALDDSNSMIYTFGTADDRVTFPHVSFTGNGTVFTVAGIAACPSVAKPGDVTTVSDATSTTFNAALTGGGANTVVALCTSGGWKVH